MTAIFRTPNFRTEVAAAFIAEMAHSSSRLYAMIGREDDPRGTKYEDGSIFSAGDGEWLVDSSPPTPENSIVYDRELWDYAIAGKYVEDVDIVFTVPRYNTITRNYSGSATAFDYSVLWNDVSNTTEYSNPASRVYEPYDFTTTNGNYNFESHNLLINEDREVYLCVARGDDYDNPAPGGPDFILNESAGDVPFLSLHASNFVEDTDFFNDGTTSILTLGTSSGNESKYTWKFICRIDQNIWDSIVNSQTNFIPMNFNTILDTADFTVGGAYEDIDTQDSIGNGNAPFILSLRHVMLRSLLEVSNTPGDGMPGNMNFRQVWLVRNPHDSQTGDAALFSFGYMPNSNPNMSPLIDVGYSDSGDYSLDPSNGDINTFEKYTGRVLYVENRQPIFRQDDQTEEIFTIFSY